MSMVTSLVIIEMRIKMAMRCCFMPLGKAKISKWIIISIGKMQEENFKRQLGSTETDYKMGMQISAKFLLKYVVIQRNSVDHGDILRDTHLDTVMVKESVCVILYNTGVCHQVNG